MTEPRTIELSESASGGGRKELGKELTESAARVFRLGGQWYFSTREGDIGPFRTREQAKREAQARRTVLKPRPGA